MNPDAHAALEAYVQSAMEAYETLHSKCRINVPCCMGGWCQMGCGVFGEQDGQ